MRSWVRFCTAGQLHIFVEGLRALGRESTTGTRAKIFAAPAFCCPQPLPRDTPICFIGLPPILLHLPWQALSGTPPPPPAPIAALMFACLPCSHAYRSAPLPPSLFAMQECAAGHQPQPTGTPTPLGPVIKTLGPLLNVAPTTCLACHARHCVKQAAGSPPPVLMADGARSVQLEGLLCGFRSCCPGGFSSHSAPGSQLVLKVFWCILALRARPPSCWNMDGVGPVAGRWGQQGSLKEPQALLLIWVESDMVHFMRSTSVPACLLIPTL